MIWNWKLDKGIWNMPLVYHLTSFILDWSEAILIAGTKFRHKFFLRKFCQNQLDGETFSFGGAFGEKLEVLSFLLNTQDLGAHFISSSTPSKPPKGACLIHSLQLEVTPGHQAPVRPQPRPWRRKLRISYFSERAPPKEKVSPSSVHPATKLTFHPTSVPPQN